jgi:ribose 5-phosphate isomerase B
MSVISDSELKEIVEKVVSRTVNGDSSRKDLPSTENQPPRIEQEGTRMVAIGADHGGYRMKEMLIEHLMKSGYKVFDCGTNSTESVDYPDFAFAVAEKVSLGQAWRGIIIDGAGIGSCITANKVPGVRAAMCYDYSTAVNSREHNGANVLTLGAGLLGDNLVRQIVDIWLVTEVGGERHVRRIDKITAVEKKYLKSG